MDHRPNAPHSAVSEVVKTFRGQWFPTPGVPYTTAQFNNNSDLTNALHLVNMLGGWQAEPDTDQKHVLRVWED